MYPRSWGISLGRGCAGLIGSRDSLFWAPCRVIFIFWKHFFAQLGDLLLFCAKKEVGKKKGAPSLALRVPCASQNPKGTLRNSPAAQTVLAKRLPSNSCDAHRAQRGINPRTPKGMLLVLNMAQPSILLGALKTDQIRCCGLSPLWRCRAPESIAEISKTLFERSEFVLRRDG